MSEISSSAPAAPVDEIDQGASPAGSGYSGSASGPSVLTFGEYPSRGGAGFPNFAGKADIDDACAAELEAAGIEVRRYEFLRGKGEVQTAVAGELHQWFFKRAWFYWTAEGPGIELAAAETLHAAFGAEARVAGHCGCPSPRKWHHGLAVGSYHVDTPAGLKALADTIRFLVARASDEPPKGEDTQVAEGRSPASAVPEGQAPHPIPSPPVDGGEIGKLVDAVGPGDAGKIARLLDRYGVLSTAYGTAPWFSSDKTEADEAVRAARVELHAALAAREREVASKAFNAGWYGKEPYGLGSIELCRDAYLRTLSPGTSAGEAREAAHDHR